MKDKDQRKILLFLHRIGYNYRTINQLTFQEINELVMAFNDEQKEKERNARRMKRKW